LLLMAGVEDSGKMSARLIWFLMGFLSIGSQVILLRAAMVTFSGNEMIIGPTLFAWTVWTGVGSLLGGRWLKGASHGHIHILLGIAAILLPATYFAVYLAKVILGVPPAFLVSPIKSFLFFIIALAPLCFILGSCFALGCRLGGDRAGRAVARTYLWDALGAGAGCIAAGGLMLPVLTGAKAVFVLAAIAGAVLAWDAMKNKSQVIIPWAGWAVFAAAMLIPALIKAPTRLSHDAAWKGYPVIAERDSRYSNLMMVHREDEYTLFVNGAPSFTYPGGPADETLAYLALSLNPKAKRVLLIGGGLSSVGAKLLDGPIQKLDYCQIDPAAIEMEKHLPSSVWQDARVSLHIEDGRQFLQNATPQTYDLVALDVGDPDTLAQNRYYTVEFFKLARRAMAEDGVLIFGAGEYANYVSNDQALFVLSLSRSLMEVFHQYFIYPLDKFYFAASEKQIFPKNSKEVIDRFQNIVTKSLYFRREIIDYDLTAERYKSISDAIDRVRFALPNWDNWPWGYASRTTMWISQFPGVENRWKWVFSLFSPVPFAALMLVLILIQTGAFRNQTKLWGLVPMIFGVGFMGMAVEIAVLYVVQVSLGALYGYVGFIITTYMIGLGFGSWLSQTDGPILKRMNNLRHAFIAFMLFTFGAFYAMVSLPYSGSISIIIILISLTFVISALSGFIFGGIAGLMEENQSDAGKLGGLLNFADLLGTALSALLCPILMIPRWGIWYTWWAVISVFTAASITGILYLRNQTKKIVLSNDSSIKLR